MAERSAESSSGSNIRNSRLPSLDELLRRSKKVLDPVSVGKPARKKRKDVHFDFATDPVTGLRSNKGTYKGNPRKKRDTGACDDETDTSFCDPLFTSSQECYSPQEINEKDDMQNDLRGLKNILEEWQASDIQKKKQVWADRQECLHESWTGSRPSLLEAVLYARFLPPNLDVCGRCGHHPPIIKCSQCIEKFICSFCDQEVHEKAVLHDREAIIDGHYVPMPTDTSRNNTGEWITVVRSLPSSCHVSCPTCQSQCTPMDPSPTSHCIVVNINGRFDVCHRNFICTSCNKLLSSSNPSVLIQLGFWPGSITNITYAFDQEMFVYWDILQKQIPGISENAFIKSLEQISQKHGRIPTINGNAFRVSFQEWKYCEYELDRLRQVNWMDCPCCSEEQHSVHVDGNMKLYRFKSAGRRMKDCYYGETFMASNEKVDKHIQEVYKGAKHLSSDVGSMCGESNWRAASNNLKKKKNLSETGLEISVCRHALAQNGVNIMYGEIYGYAHYLQVNHYIPKKALFFWYDVVCKYWPWLQKKDPNNAITMKPALSVMHAKAHAWYCQAIWGGRWQKGAAATTGEEAELVNSHFSRLGSTTKHMLPEGREELLTEHALRWNKRKIINLPIFLARRHNKVEKQLTELKTNIDKEFSLLGSNHQCAVQWKDEVLQVAKAAENESQHKPKITDDEKAYLTYLNGVPNQTVKEETLYAVGKEMYGWKHKVSILPSATTNHANGDKVLEDKATKYLENKMQRLQYSMTQMAVNMGKFADGSKQRQRLRKKITSEKEKLSAAIQWYNKLGPIPVDPKDIEQGTFFWEDSERRHSDLPLSTKRRVVDKIMEAERFEEELGLLKREMLSFLKFYKDIKLPSLRQEQIRLQSLMEGNEENSSSDLTDGCYSTTCSQIIPGKLALVMEGIDFAMQQIAAGMSAFLPFLTSDLDEFRQFLLTQRNEIDDVDDSCNGDTEQDDEAEEDEDEESDILHECQTNVISDALKAVSTAPVAPIPPAAVSNNIASWMFPPNICQGRYNGRNGSNACSVIALLLGYTILRWNVTLPHIHLPLAVPLVEALCGCIELGNRIYDLFRHSLPSRYLSIQEAAGITDTWLGCSVKQPLPVRLEDRHQPSTVSYQLLQAVPQMEGIAVAFIIINQRTSTFFLAPDRITYIDSHSHGLSTGAIAITADSKDIPDFCKAIWDLEGHSGTTFGNLVFVQFY